MVSSTSPGHNMPEIKGLGNFGHGTTDLKHEAGHVYLLDFWATWCPPCQKPMAHNCEMIKKHNATGDWSNVHIIGLSIDDDKATLVSHVNAKGWTAVTHYHTGGTSASDDWGITGVPHCILVDKSGKIVWRGHPASLDLEGAISKLAKGDSL